MDHSNRPIIDNSDQRPYLRPYARSGFGVPVYPMLDMAIREAEKQAKKQQKTQYVVELDDGFIAVSHTEYSVLFGDEPGNDVVYRADP